MLLDTKLALAIQKGQLATIGFTLQYFYVWSILIKPSAGNFYLTWSKFLCDGENSNRKVSRGTLSHSYETASKAGDVYLKWKDLLWLIDVLHLPAVMQESQQF